MIRNPFSVLKTVNVINFVANHPQKTLSWQRRGQWLIGVSHVAILVSLTISSSLETTCATAMFLESCKMDKQKTSFKERLSYFSHFHVSKYVFSWLQSAVSLLDATKSYTLGALWSDCLVTYLFPPSSGISNILKHNQKSFKCLEENGNLYTSTAAWHHDIIL